MKRFNIIGAILLLMAIATTSCVKDLDKGPIDPNTSTSNNVYTDEESYKEGLAKLYGSFSLSGQKGPDGDGDVKGIDEGFSSYLRTYWNVQELTTDEAVNGWNDGTLKDLHWQTWTTSDDFATAIYSRIFYNISIANEYIRATDGKTGEIGYFNAEARFVRALAYFHALDLFGNVPFVTEADKAGSFLPKQISRSELYTWLEDQLLGLEDKLKPVGTNEYGRVDQGALWTLLAKFYLNAKVYTGVDKNTECITYCKKIIASGKYELAEHYRNIFCGDNDLCKEIIFPITFDGFYTRTWGGMVFLVHAQIGGSMNPVDYGVGSGSGWGGNRTTKAFVNKFSDLTGETDKRALFHTAGQSLDITDINQFSNGYALRKYSNLRFNNLDLIAKSGKIATKSDSLALHYDGTFVDSDFPMFRLADVYLMYAEAVVRGGTGGDAATALQYVNDLRDRAYESTSGQINASDLTLDFIIDERARELYWETSRRTDLIRFGLFTTNKYLWPWKGKVEGGTATGDYRNLFPIPATDMAANPTLKQNTGY